ncbi:MAG: VWA domain-containing protein [Clostridia bacterium]|nr:VWA domain-containing protein [Clostridia bacterium]
MKNKIFMGLFLIIILIANVSFASYSTVTMSVVEEPICTIKLEENSKFEKKLIAKDLANKEVTLQLQVINGEIADKPTGEIMLVLDDSNSMNDKVSGTTRKDLIFNSAKSLITSFLENNTQLKIGVVRFSTNTDVSKEGTIADASVVSPLSNDATALNNSISSIETNGPRTDLQAGLSLASEQFTKTDNNKYMIILTDGVPNVAIDYDKNYYSDDVINKTKKQLQTLSSQGIKITTMLSGINDESYVPATTTKNFGEIIKEIFGTPDKPTVGNFYYVTDAEIEKTIKTDIYNALIPIEKTLKNITVVDYFPEEIIKNFDFAYVSNANIGTISSKVDTTNNSITWTIPELSSGKTATVQYKLKLKENFDSAIVDKILNTNKKVDIDYIDLDEVKQTKTSDITPKIKLTEPPAVLPKAGTLTLIGFSVLTIGLLVYSVIRLTIIHRKMN